MSSLKIVVSDSEIEMAAQFLLPIEGVISVVKEKKRWEGNEAQVHCTAESIIDPFSHHKAAQKSIHKYSLPRCRTLPYFF